MWKHATGGKSCEKKICWKRGGRAVPLSIYDNDGTDSICTSSRWARATSNRRSPSRAKRCLTGRFRAAPLRRTRHRVSWCRGRRICAGRRPVGDDNGDGFPDLDVTQIRQEASSSATTATVPSLTRTRKLESRCAGLEFQRRPGFDYIDNDGTLDRVRLPLRRLQEG